MSNEKLQYNPRIFDVNTIDDAKKIILTPEAGMATNERWEKETPFLKKDISDFFKNLTKESVIVDFGCGIGRVSKEIIDAIGCKVIGIDISQSMRQLAIKYVNNLTFAR